MLHGEVKVNDVVVGTWQARNLHTVWSEAAQGRVTTYECDLTYRDTQGYPCEAWGYLVNQREGVGPLLLAAKVIEQGARRARRKRVE